MTYLIPLKLVNDVTDTNCRAQNGNNNGGVFATFKHRLKKERKKEKKYEEEVLTKQTSSTQSTTVACLFLVSPLYSVTTDKARGASLLRYPFNSPAADFLRRGL